MKAIRVARAEASLDAVNGCVLARDVRDANGRIALGKGRVMNREAFAVLELLGWDELHLVAPDAGEVHETEAGNRLARAVAGAGIFVGSAGGGHWPLEAMHRGILRVDVCALDEVNGIEGLCVYTLFDGQVVDAGEIVARAKIIPFVIANDALSCGESQAQVRGGIVSVLPFLRMRVGALVQESLGPRAMARFRESLGEKVEWFGSTLLEPVFVAPSAREVEGGVQQLVDDGAQIIAVAGSKAMDPLDPAFEGLDRLGATMVRHGVAAHPGSLCWLARARDVSIVGMPSCGLFSQATVFDLLLPRLLTGEILEARVLASMGHGGFLTRDMAFRFPPYRAARSRGAVE